VCFFFIKGVTRAIVVIRTETMDRSMQAIAQRLVQEVVMSSVVEALKTIFIN
jgi:hypothetical protein